MHAPEQPPRRPVLGPIPVDDLGHGVAAKQGEVGARHVASRSSGTTSSSAERPISSSGAQPSTRCHELLTSRKRPSAEKTASRSCESSQNPDLSESAAAAATTARSRSIAAISTCAIDSTKARSSVENAARRRLHATNAPNAAAPDPIGAATRLRIPKASERGCAEVRLRRQVRAEQGLPRIAEERERATQLARRHRRDREVLAGARADRGCAVRCALEHDDQVARQRLVKRPGGLVEQLGDRPALEGERAERADGGPAGSGDRGAARARAHAR